ncbi:T9SS type A sorting domain-containing protein [bacterium]|nr:T9SS type A sorting domain-containing protein [bacterium]
MHFTKACLIGILIFTFSCTSNAGDTTEIGSTTVVVDTVYSGLDIPWEILYGPDGHLWFTERHGKVSRINPLTKERKVILDLRSEVQASGESGMLGMALHPNFPQDPRVFIVYTFFDSNIKERLVSYTYSNDSLIDPVTLLDNIPGNTNHIGSRLLFMKDGTLLMTTGDALQKSESQNPNSLLGKVLRLNQDGSIPDDNPTNSLVYSLGHRNAQGMCFGPDDRIYLSEHGPNTDDEFHELFPSANYGWPNVAGFCSSPAELSFCDTVDVTEPIIAWTPTIAPSDMIYYENSQLPELDGKFLMTVLKNKHLRAIELNEAGDSVISQEIHFNGEFGRLRDICIGSYGTIYLATNGPDWSNSQPNTHSIIRIRTLEALSSNSGPDLKMSIYPNPAKDKITIDLPWQSESEIKISNSIGETVIVTKERSIDVSTLDSGVYFIYVSHPTHHMILRKKVVLE